MKARVTIQSAASHCGVPASTQEKSVWGFVVDQTGNVRGFDSNYYKRAPRRRVGNRNYSSRH